MVAAWSVDRLGRSLIDLVGILQEFHAKHVDLYLHQQGIDTTTPAGKAMFQMMGVFAEFERSMIHERVMVGLARAKAEGTQLGRPAKVAGNAAMVKALRAARRAGKSIRTIAREQGVGIGTVSRLTGWNAGLAEKTNRLSQPYIAALGRANLPPGCPRSSWRRRTHNPPPKFSYFELITGRDAPTLTDADTWWSPARPADLEGTTHADI